MHDADKLPHVYFGSPSKPTLDWRKAKLNHDPDDDELRVPARSVVKMLRVNPMRLFPPRQRKDGFDEKASLRQATTLIAKSNFQFRPPGGRVVKVSKGDRFWITSTMLDQDRTGTVAVARDRQNLHYDYRFKSEQIYELFEVVPK